jgi:hypothetical protein
MAMTPILQTTCPGCKNTLRLAPEWLHGPMRCKHCQLVFQIKDRVPPATPAAGVTTLAAEAGRFAPYQQRRQPAYELVFALVAVIGITLWYILQAQHGVPRSSSLVGHSLGIVGFLMMLSSETLYSLRKRVHRFSLGPMSYWLQLHIFTGIVGPYLVLLHAAGKFNGLAGVLTLLIVVMVVSGFVGRYIYTAVPRTLDGAEVAVRALEEQIASADRQLQSLGIQLPPAALAAAPASGWMLVLGRGWLRWHNRWHLRQSLRELNIGSRAKAQLLRLLAERYRMQLQIHSLAGLRRSLALWHVFHIPLGVVVFTLAFCHIGAALYFATFLK